MPEIPSSIKYDFLLILLGTGIAYLTLRYIEPPNLLGAVMIFFGAYLFIQGITFAKDEYEMDIDFKEMSLVKEKLAFISFLNGKDIITQKSKNDIIQSLKRRVNKR